MSKISILLTCHNRKIKTLRCLSTLYKAELPYNCEMEVFLVDDGSTDGTTESIKDQFPEVKIIQGNGNLFWNRGMHLAWDTAVRTKKYDYYIWLNDDVELFPDAITNSIKTSEDNNAIVVGTLRSGKGKNPTYGGRNEKGDLIIPEGKPQNCQTFNGNFVIIPSWVYDKIGNLDKLFIHAIGDYDYALRAKKSGIISMTTPEYCGICERNLSLPQWCLPEVPFFKRLKALYSPLGNSHPYYYFIFIRRHYGIFLAFKHFLSIHLRLIFPTLWKN